MGHGVRRADRIVAAAVLVVATLALSRIAPPRHRALAWLGVLSGPLAGWLAAARADAFPEALQLLVPVTALCAAPILRFVQPRDRGWLGASGLAWLGAGYFFTIAMWV